MIFGATLTLTAIAFKSDTGAVGDSWHEATRKARKAIEHKRRIDTLGWVLVIYPEWVAARHLDYCAAWVETFVWSGGTVSSRRRYTWLNGNELPNSFGEDADGELYITSESGNLFTIVPQP